ncbi:hypothetical protein V8E54_001475 [Elaphomyces granulatus]
MFLHFPAITLLLGAAILMLVAPSISHSADGIIQDDAGVYHLEPNGTIFSFDGNHTVIDSKQLTADEFKTLTGCNMVTPGMPSSADHETEQCLQKKKETTIPISDVSRKRDSELFERALTCALFICQINSQCQRLTTVSCKGCLHTGPFVPNVCTTW